MQDAAASKLLCEGSSKPKLKGLACSEGQMPSGWALPSTGHLHAMLQVRKALIPHCSAFFSYILSSTYTGVSPGSLSSPGRWSTDLNLHLIWGGIMLFLSLDSRHQKKLLQFCWWWAVVWLGSLLRFFLFFPLLCLSGACYL